MQSGIVAVLAAILISVAACSSEGNEETRPEVSCIEIPGGENFDGTAENETVLEEADIELNLVQTGCNVRGDLIVHPPLFGSGPLSGSVVGDRLVFVVPEETSDFPSDLIFEGDVTDTSISGSYEVPSVAQSGRWVVFSVQQLDSARSALFWIAATTLARVPDDAAFETARNRLFEVLFAEWNSKLEQIESHGVDAYEDFPYCINAISITMELADLRQSASAVEAGPFSNRLAEIMSGLDVVVSEARLFSNSGFSHQESLRLCNEFEDEARAARGWAPSQVN